MLVGAHLLLIFIWTGQILGIQAFAFKDPPEFPPQFTALFNDSIDLEPLGEQLEVYVDKPGKRAAIFSHGIDNIRPYYLIYSPPFAQPNSSSVNGFTLFSLNPEVYPGRCWYQTPPFTQTGPFPSQWLAGSGEIGPLFYFPTELEYKGKVDDNGIEAERWDSTQTCTMRSMNIGPIPCFSYLISSSTQLPLKYILAHQSQSSFDRDSYFVRSVLKIAPNIPTDVFNLPADWLTQCGNANNGYDVTPSRGYVCTPTANDNFTLFLSSPPVDKLGPVHVKFELSPSDYYNCTDCVNVAPGTILTFNSANWREPARIYLQFLKYGRSSFIISASGGGYEYQWESVHIEVTACDGVAGWGCKSNK